MNQFLQSFLSSSNSQNTNSNQNSNNSVLPTDFAEKFYANAPAGFQKGSIIDFLKLCFSNIGMIVEMAKTLQGRGDMAKIQAEAQQAIKNGSIKPDQVNQIKSALEMGKSLPNIMSQIKSLF